MKRCIQDGLYYDREEVSTLSAFGFTFEDSKRRVEAEEPEIIEEPVREGTKEEAYWIYACRNDNSYSRYSKMGY